MNTPNDTFGEIDLLQEIFAGAKKLRRTRHPAHVLVVDDDPLTRRVMVGALGEQNAMITEENAYGAAASYLLYAPDIVFLDIGLPDVDGFRLMSQILMIDPDAFVVMVSSHTDTDTITRAITAGAKGFIAKPFKKEILRSHIQGSAIHHHKSQM